MRFNNADIGITFIFCTICHSRLSGIFPCIFPLWQRGIEGDFLNKSILHKISPYPSLEKRGSEEFWADPRQARTRARMTFSGQKPMSLRLSKGHKNRPLYIPPYQGGKEGGIFDTNTMPCLSYLNLIFPIACYRSPLTPFPLMGEGYPPLAAPKATRG